MDINLFFVAGRKMGQKTTYTAHLTYCLRSMGHNVRLYTVGGATQQRQLELMRGVTCQQLDPDTACRMARDPASHSLVTAIDEHRAGHAWQLCNVGAVPVLHGIRDLEMFTGKMEQFVGAITTCRWLLPSLYRELDLSEFIPLPYKSTGGKARLGFRRSFGVSISRVTGDARIDWLLKANELLGPEKQLSIHGELEEKYGNQLNRHFPRWRRAYGGKFQFHIGAAAQLCRRARFCLDLRQNNDGGAIPYTVLEAWDGDAAMIMHKSWVTDTAISPAIFVGGVDVFGVASVEELVSAINHRGGSNLPVRIRNRRDLKKHEDVHVIPRYQSFLEKVKARAQSAGPV